MYLSHYGLTKKPFDISPNPEFLWLGEKHREGLAVLQYGILENKGFLMITGEIGTGKTALIRTIHKKIQAKIIVVSIPDPGLSLIDFYNILASELNMGKRFESKGEFLVHFKRFILSAAAGHRRLLLIIDESQRLTSVLLEEIRLLSNIDLEGKVVLNTFFVGQKEFKTLLQNPENQAVRQRITVSYELTPLTENEVRQYVEHRLKVAGAKKEIFTEGALRLIHNYSKGYPRLVNIICDHALMSGYSRGVDRIDTAIIDECGEELKVAIGTIPQKEPVQAAISSKTAAPVPEHSSAVAVRRGISWHRAAIFAGIVIFVVGGWYWTGDRVSDELARWGGSKELAPATGSNVQAPKEEPQMPASPKAAQGGVPLEGAKTAVASSDAEASLTPRTRGTAAEPGQKSSGRDARGGAPTAKSIPAASSVMPPAASAVPATPPLSTAPSPAPIAAAAPAVLPQSPPALQPAPGQISAATVEAIRLKEFVIFFSKNSSEVPIYAYDTVAGIASLLKTFPEAWLSIEGHTDSAGDPVLNKSISEGRAASVKSFLEGEGISPKRLKAIGYGPEKPLESNSTPEGRTKNRRVVIRVMVAGAP